MGRSLRSCVRRQQGVSLPELLVVIALLALAAMITIPLTARRVQELQLRTSVDQFVASLRAARMVAVATGRATPVTVTVHPGDRYEYTDAEGRLRSVDLPSGVRIDETSSPSVTFQANGSVGPPAPATTVLKARLPKGIVERWIVETPRSGIPVMTSERVEIDGPDW